VRCSLSEGILFRGVVRLQYFVPRRFELWFRRCATLDGRRAIGNP
jgi:hypothetical protein